MLNVNMNGQDICNMEPNHDLTCSEIYLGPNRFIFGSVGTLNQIQYAPIGPASPTHVAA